MSNLQIYPITVEGKWRGSEREKEWYKVPVAFAIRHEPTRSIYFGSSGDMAQAFYSWYQRLRGLYTQPKLSLSFRAIYTRREDFVFVVLKTWERGTLANEAMNMAIENVNTLRLKRPDKLLNMNNSVAEKQFWMEQTPVERRFW